MPIPRHPPRRARAALLGLLALACGDLRPQSSAKRAAKEVAYAVEPGQPTPPGGLDARAPGRAGTWYAGTPTALDAQIDALMASTGASPGGQARVLLTPHGGLKYSGRAAAEVWARAEVAPVVIILAPNHFKEGERLAIWTEGPWMVPGHALQVDAALTARARAHMPQLVPDRAAFSHHEMELQMPFLQRKRPDARMVLISIRDSEKHHFPLPAAEVQRLGEGLAAFLKELEAEGTPTTLVLTTDLVHYVPLAQSDEQDAELMRLITSYDIEGLRRYVTKERVSICGEVPVAVGMTALAALGKPTFDWQSRSNSLHYAQDPESVVGYPGGVIWR